MTEKRKIYTSFHDLSPREYMYIPSASLETGKTGSFSKIEIQHIVIAMGVLTIAFSFAFSPLYRFDVSIFLAALPLSFLGMVTAFLVHELAHKFTAQRFGLWSEFRMYPMGLLLSLVVSMVTGFVIAAPGAVMFRGDSRGIETGKIAAAGPSANIITASIMYPLSTFFFETSIAGILVFIGYINALLGVFNLLPFGPLDGMKILRTNGMLWAVLLIIGLILFTLYFQRGFSLFGV